MVTAASLIPFTQRALVAAVERSEGPGEHVSLHRTDQRWHHIALVVVSGVVMGLLLARAGWSVVALPPLILLVALIQLAYCDMTQFLLPRTMVHATTVAVAIGAVAAAGATDEWHRLLLGSIGGVALFIVFLSINLMNPAWMAFGDVRLAPAVGLGLAWVTPVALLQAFFLANVLAAVVGLVLMAARRGGRKTALPFGLFLAIASAIVIFAWS
jgi:leader peptidase (prepilin peptidase)/N-methyltransferase